jgi:hypothetical protein
MYTINMYGHLVRDGEVLSTSPLEELHRLSQEVERLRGLLKPFARRFEGVDGDIGVYTFVAPDNDWGWEARNTVDDFRKVWREFHVHD